MFKGAEDGDYKSGVYFARRGEACTLYSEFTTNHHMYSIVRDSEGEMTSSSSDDGYAIVGRNGFGGLAAVGAYETTTFGEDGSSYTYGGSHTTTVKAGLLVRDPLPNTKYPVWVWGTQTGMDSETGMDMGNPIYRVFLCFEVSFDSDEIAWYKIGGKVKRYASKELLLPDSGREFETEEDFLKEFVKEGYIAQGDSGYLRFKEGEGKELPLEDQCFFTPNSVAANGEDFFRFFDYTSEEKN